MSLDCVIPTLKTGDEKLSFNSHSLNYSLLDFWRWSVSDILSNATRGRFAEFIVATAAVINLKNIRDEWGAYDLETDEGIKIEVKSTAYIQSWFQKALSKISFSIKPAYYWEGTTNIRSEIAGCSADVYVFCHFHHEEKHTCDPLNINHWSFYVLATKEVNNYTRSQHSITLNSLRKLTKELQYNELSEQIVAKYNLHHSY